jgi:hypothetical protein
MAPVVKAPRRYFIEFNAALVLFIASVVGRKLLAPGIADPVLRDVIVVLPVLPVVLCALAVFRFYHRMDEYHRLQLLEALAFSAGVTAVVSASWGFLEDVGLPHLQMFDAMMVMMLSWAAAALWLGWKDKISEGRGGAALRSVAMTFLYVAIGTATFGFIMVVAGFVTPWWELALFATVLFIARMGFFIFSKTSAC